MLTARLEDKVVRASKELKGKDLAFLCRDPNCKSPEMLLVAGERERRIPHFRHKSNCGCKFAHGETEWHLEWKSHFERVEVDIGIDPITNEHNYADAVVKESNGRDVVLEFQHSPISLKEQEDRERFYQSKGGLVWIVDANKTNALKALDRAIAAKRFVQGGVPQFGNDWFTVENPEEVFSKDWVSRPVGVVFDYGPEKGLVLLMAGRVGNKAVCSNMLPKQMVVEILRLNIGLIAHGVQEHLSVIAQKEALKRAALNQQQGQMNSSRGWFPKQFRKGPRGTWRM